MAFDYRADLMCSDKNTDDSIFEIPAVIRRGNESVPAGTLDLTALLDKSKREGSAFFQFPSVQWLVEKGWIDEAPVNDGPVFLKKFQLYPLPTLLNQKPTIETQLILVKNTLPKNTTIAFDEEVWSVFKYDENNELCDTRNKLKSPYSVPNCDAVKDVCVRSYGEFSGPYYPSLTSLWRIHFNIPIEAKNSLPYPIGPFYLKVKAEICFDQMSSKKSSKNSRRNTCCAEGEGKHYTDRKGICQICPGESVPRLNGYFCELCPVGFTGKSSGTHGYGCLPPTETIDVNNSTNS